jgi:hypothetical protein
VTRATAPGSIRNVTAAGAITAYVGAVVLAGALGVHQTSLASSPAGVRDGEITQLLTSGFAVAGSWLPAALILAGSGLLAARAAGAQRAVLAALVAHVGGTLLPYAALALVRIHSPYAWEGEWYAEDYGVSLVFGAWLALAAVRAPNRATGLATALFALALARPALTLTGVEHACALAIGAGFGIRAGFKSGVLRSGGAKRAGVAAGSQGRLDAIRDPRTPRHS